MKIDRQNTVVIILGALVVALALIVVIFNQDELQFKDDEYEEEIETVDTAIFEDGTAVVVIEADSQFASGVEVVKLSTYRSRIGLTAFGEIVDISSLLEDRESFIASRGKESATAALVDQLKIEFSRAKVLFNDHRNISEREFQEAKYRLEVAQSEFRNLTNSRVALRDRLISRWGKEIFGWIEDGKSSQLHELLDTKKSIARIDFPVSNETAAASQNLVVTPVRRASESANAKYISDDFRATEKAMGINKLFLVDRYFPVGTKLQTIIGSGSDEDGVLIPLSAVVWHVGKAWVYTTKDGSHFSRKELVNPNDVGEGWFDSQTFNVGDEVVVVGAQLLLSEELKYQIRNENED